MAEMSLDQQRAVAMASARLRLDEAPAKPAFAQVDEFSATPEAPNAAARAGRGMMDLYQGIKQLGLMAADAFNPKSQTLSGLVTDKSTSRADDYTKQVGDEIAKYEKGRGKDAGFDWMRLAGNITTPLTLIPGGVGATAGTRVLTGAAAGGLQGGLMFTNEGDSKAAQIATGVAAGGILPAVVEGGARMIRGAVNTGGNAVANVVRGGIDDAQITNTVRQTLMQQGIDFNTLATQAKEALKTEANAQLQAGGSLNSEALGRIARAAQVDPRLQLTRGQATRTPQDWQTEQNLRGIQGVGDDLRARFGQQGQVLGDAATRIQRGTGATTDRPYQAGERAIAAVRSKFDETGDEVSALYRAARETVGAQADVPLGPMQGRAMQALNEFDDVIPGPIKSRLQALGIERMGPVKPTKAFTVEEAEALDKLINKRWDAANKPLTAALSELKGALRDSLDAVGSETGTAAAQAYQAAKGQARARFDEFGQKIARAATEDVAPDRFVKKFVTGGDVRDIRGLVRTLTTGTPEQLARGRDALNNIRAATLTEIFEGKGAVVDGMLSGAKLDKALKDIGPERLNAIFTPQQVRDLQLLRGVSLDLTRPPALADINYSRTASALANLLGSIGKIPGLGMAAKIAQSETERVQRGAADAALRGGAATPGASREIMSSAGQNALARRVAPYAAVPVNSLAYQQNQ